MRFVTKELVTLTMILILAFLVLTNSTGFARGVGAMSKGWVGVIRAFQGRR